MDFIRVIFGLLAIAFAAGLAVGFRYAIGQYDRIMWKNSTSSREHFVVSVIGGGLAAATWCLTIIVMGVLYPKYEWSLSVLAGTIFMSLIIGIIVMFGTLWSLFVTRKFRNFLFKWLERKLRRDEDKKA